MTRKFLPGSEWLYMKIYAGNRTSDVVLQDILSPTIQSLEKEKLIIKWFFIRYYDPKPHLRLRFQLNDVKCHNTVLNKINQSLDSYVKSGEIIITSLNSYNREIERYGETSMEYAEHLFYKSSQLIINFLEYDDKEKIIVSMFYFDQLLSKLKISDEEKFGWIIKLNRAFKTEFNSDKKLNSQLDKKFRNLKPKYISFIENVEFEEIRSLIVSSIDDSSKTCEKIILLDKDNLLSIQLSEFFQSVFHMHFNRTFNSDQRLFEMIIYDYLNRYYKYKIYQETKIIN